jgi:uncharacterized phage protein gp47/JayE
MADAPTFNDYFTAGRAEAIDRRPELTFDEGDISEMEMAAAAAMADHLTEYTAQRVKATFLDGAFGNDLTTLADDRYGLQRLAANAATVTITLTRASGTLIGTVPAGTTVATQKDSLGNEVQYTTDVDQAFASGQLTANVACTCTATGPGGNVAAGTINRMVSTGLFDTFTVTNAARAAGGADTEDDDSLKDRCRQFYSTLRRGTLKALEFGARGVAGVANVTASEPGDGTVSLFVSDASGGYSPTLLTDVSTEIENWRAGGRGRERVRRQHHRRWRHRRLADATRGCGREGGRRPERHLGPHQQTEDRRGPHHVAHQGRRHQRRPRQHPGRGRQLPSRYGQRGGRPGSP